MACAIHFFQFGEEGGQAEGEGVKQLRAGVVRGETVNLKEGRTRNTYQLNNALLAGAAAGCHPLGRFLAGAALPLVVCARVSPLTSDPSRFSCNFPAASQVF